MEIPDVSTLPLRSSLFTLRVWREALGAKPGEVRMQVRHVLGGETRYCREWAQLVEYLERKLHETPEAGSSIEENSA